MNTALNYCLELMSKLKYETLTKNVALKQGKAKAKEGTQNIRS